MQECVVMILRSLLSQGRE